MAWKRHLHKDATATRVAEEGAEVMQRADAAMDRISSSSTKIPGIIGMIDDVAFQTNLLALNASVEVRRLAQAAATASNEVKALVETSGVEVAAGGKLVSAAAERLMVMLSAVRASTDLMDDVARESREQAVAVEEVNVAVRQLDEMTQHNAALVEQTKARANELDALVEIFWTDAKADSKLRAAA